jgi:hypothetical protein
MHKVHCLVSPEMDYMGGCRTQMSTILGWDVYLSESFNLLLEVGRIRKKGYFGKKGMQEESDSWKEKQHAFMHGRTNDTRVRVFVIHCNG